MYGQSVSQRQSGASSERPMFVNGIACAIDWPLCQRMLSSIDMRAVNTQYRLRAIAVKKASHLFAINSLIYVDIYTSI